MAVKDLSKVEQKAVFITGDYKTLKEFSERENISYEYLRQYGKKWLSQKSEHLTQIANTVVTECAVKMAETKISEIQERQNATLAMCNKLRNKADKLLTATYSEKGVNALASALYRVNEVESNLLGYTKPTADEEAIANAKNFLVTVKKVADGTD